MKKFCFVYLDNINRMPYIKKYINILEYRYDIIYWNRNNSIEEIGAENYYRMYSKAGRNAVSKPLYKLIAYIKFGYFAKKILKKNNYAGVFVFTPNVGMLCYKVLMNKYRKKYILDIRDFWKEDKKWLQKIEKSLVKHSYANVISSKAYTNFLPNSEYILTHNSQYIDEDMINKFRNGKRKNANKIVLACIGGVKYINYDKEVINYFANDDRFELRYIGRGYEQLISYCEERGITNVIAEGGFPMENTMEKYEDTDIILNMYGNKSPKLDYALSNKLYFSAQLGLPILVCEDTYMEEISKKYGFGFTVNLKHKEDKDKLFVYYSNIDFEELYKNCDEFLLQVKKDEGTFENAIRKFIVES